MLKNALIALAAGVCLALSIPVAGAARTAGEHVDDSTIATTTKAALIESDEVSASDINVEVFKGAVQLAGFVDSQNQKDAAIVIAQGIDGVAKVLDAMVVLTGDRSFGQTIDDTTIQTKLKAELAGEQGMGGALAINTEVRQGKVLLSGFVADEPHKAKAGEIAKGISGVKSVHNMIAIER